MLNKSTTTNTYTPNIRKETLIPILVRGYKHYAICYIILKSKERSYMSLIHLVNNINTCKQVWLPECVRVLWCKAQDVQTPTTNSHTRSKNHSENEIKTTFNLRLHFINSYYFILLILYQNLAHIINMYNIYESM